MKKIISVGVAGLLVLGVAWYVMFGSWVEFMPTVKAAAEKDCYVQLPTLRTEAFLDVCNKIIKTDTNFLPRFALGDCSLKIPLSLHRNKELLWGITKRGIMVMERGAARILNPAAHEVVDSFEALPQNMVALVSKDQNFSLTLPENMTTGYSWQVCGETNQCAVVRQENPPQDSQRMGAPQRLRLRLHASPRRRLRLT